MSKTASTPHRRKSDPCLPETGLLSDAEAKQALKMVDDRNLTTYTYDEAFVESLMGRFPEYDAVMHSWLEKLK